MRKSTHAMIEGRELVYAGWARLERVQVRMPNGALVERHIESHGQGVAVLPYDPDRRTVVLVSMPRAVIVDAGLPDLLEPVAGAIDSPIPEDCARREALEEAGLRLTTLVPIGTAWPMPYLSTDRVHLYLAPYTSESFVGPGGGSGNEDECIIVHELTISRLAELMRRGELTDMKTLLLSQALMLRHPGLFTPAI